MRTGEEDEKSRWDTAGVYGSEGACEELSDGGSREWLAVLADIAFNDLPLEVTREIVSKSECDGPDVHREMVVVAAPIVEAPIDLRLKVGVILIFTFMGVAFGVEQFDSSTTAFDHKSYQFVYGETGGQSFDLSQYLYFETGLNQGTAQMEASTETLKWRIKKGETGNVAYQVRAKAKRRFSTGLVSSVVLCYLEGNFDILPPTYTVSGFELFPDDDLNCAGYAFMDDVTFERNEVVFYLDFVGTKKTRTIATLTQGIEFASQIGSLTTELLGAVAGGTGELPVGLALTLPSGERKLSRYSRGTVAVNLLVVNEGLSWGHVRVEFERCRAKEMADTVNEFVDTRLVSDTPHTKEIRISAGAQELYHIFLEQTSNTYCTMEVTVVGSSQAKVAAVLGIEETPYRHTNIARSLVQRGDGYNTLLVGQEGSGTAAGVYTAWQLFPCYWC